MLTVIPEITCTRIFHIKQPIASRAFNINFNKTMCVLMALAIDSVVPVFRIYKMFGVLEWIPSYHAALQDLQS